MFAPEVRLNRTVRAGEEPEEHKRYKECLEIVGNGSPTGSVLEETVAVSVTISINVQNRHSRILLRALLRGRMREMRREPEVPEAEVPVVEVKSGTLQNACSTRPRVVADWGNVLVCTSSG